MEGLWIPSDVTVLATLRAHTYDNSKSVELSPYSSYLLILRIVEQVGQKREGESAARLSLKDYRKYQQAGGIWSESS
jgi:hypothetical protein